MSAAAAETEEFLNSDGWLNEDQRYVDPEAGSRINLGL